MNHIHLKTITSTQESFYDHFGHALEGQLLSADIQTNGIGQHGRNWSHVDHALSMSFSLKPANNITLTSLEIPVILQSFFNKNLKTKIKYKWPNDLFNLQDQKCGGLLIHKKGEDDLVVGLGINLTPFSQNLEAINAGSLISNSKKINLKELSLSIYKFILENRLSNEEIIQKWNKDCLHLNEPIKIIDHDIEHLGNFIGIGSNGQALLQDGDEIKEIYSGSLFLRT